MAVSKVSRKSSSNWYWKEYEIENTKKYWISFHRVRFGLLKSNGNTAIVTKTNRIKSYLYLCRKNLIGLSDIATSIKKLCLTAGKYHDRSQETTYPGGTSTIFFDLSMLIIISWTWVFQRFATVIEKILDCLSLLFISINVLIQEFPWK